jgi:hypothetical protein
VTPAPTPESCGTLQGQINAAPAGSVLDLTGCSYTGTASIGKSLTLRGATLRSPAGQTGLMIARSGVTLDDVTIIGPQFATYDGSENGIETVGGIADLTIRNSHVSRFGGICIRAYKVTDLLITGSAVADCVYAGIMGLSLVRGSIDGNTIDRIGVLGSSANGGNAYGIAISAQDFATDPQSADTVVSDNTIRDVPTWHGLDTHAGIRIRFLRNIVRGSRHAIFVTGGNGSERSNGVIVDSNTVYAPSSNIQYGIVSVYSDNGRVSNNTISGWPSGHEILTTDSGALVNTNLAISGNIIRP